MTSKCWMEKDLQEDGAEVDSGDLEATSITTNRSVIRDHLAPGEIVSHHGDKIDKIDRMVHHC